MAEVSNWMSNEEEYWTAAIPKYLYEIQATLGGNPDCQPVGFTCPCPAQPVQKTETDGPIEM